MRLVRLLLDAYGPFTGAVLDFGAAARGLHLVHGPNEAGKSSALHALVDLRFGIEHSSRFDFLHPYERMRVAGVFVDDAGSTVALARRKGRARTLSRIDPADPARTSDEPLLPQHEAALTGGLDRAEFEAMYGLDHARLRAGGQALLAGEGELGAALFEASAGTRGIPALLAALDADAKSLYNRNARAQHPVINEARRTLDAQKAALREALARPADWQALQRTHEDARDALATCEAAMQSLRRTETELTELRNVAPLLRELDLARAELERLAGAPDLAPEARERRLAAEQAYATGERETREAQADLERCARERARLVVDTPLLEAAQAIDRFAAGVETAALARIETEKLRGRSDTAERELTARTRRIAPGRTVAEVLAAWPSDADRVTLEGHVAAMARLEARIEARTRLAEEAQRRLRAASSDAQPPPDPAVRRALGEALRIARQPGDVGQRLASLDASLRAVGSRLAGMLVELGLDGEASLRSTRPPLAAEVEAERNRRARLDGDEREWRREGDALRRDLQVQQVRARELAAEGEVVTAATLRSARERRDAGWRSVREAYVERSVDPAHAGAAFDPARPLPEAFEAAQAEADRQADLLRADAARAAMVADCHARIQAMAGAIAESEARLAALGEARVRGERSWAERLAGSGLPVLPPEALDEWLAGRRAAVDATAQIEGLRAERADLVEAARAAGAALVAAIEAAGESPAAEASAAGLAVLADQAAACEERLTAEAAGSEERARQLEQLHADVAHALGELEAARRSIAPHAAALAAWHERLLLAPGSPAEAVRARLGELAECVRASDDLADARNRLRLHATSADDLDRQARELAARLGEAVDASLERYAEGLCRRLTEAREADQQARALDHERALAEARLRKADAAVATERATLARLCVAAGVPSVDALPAVERDAAAKRDAMQRLRDARGRLAAVSARPEDILRAALADRDPLSLDADRERCGDEIERQEAAVGAARSAEERARRALEAIDSSDRAAAAREAIESAAARYRAALGPWARLRLAHAVLSEALKAFRAKAQGPMVEKASAYFALMTGGRYPALQADESDGRPVLRAVRASGHVLGMEALSEGTADQLYLALRLAALDLRREARPSMPLVLDDVLITSDDQRAANVLRALARYAETSQVLLFTHHAHLLDVARHALGEGGLTVHRLDVAA